jgi:hypothetical protein
MTLNYLVILMITVAAIYKDGDEICSKDLPSICSE